jgi:Leucine-rich repeat (LRR) protein
MNTSTMATILGTAALGIIRSSGSKSVYEYSEYYDRYVYAPNRISNSKRDADKKALVTMIDFRALDIEEIPDDYFLQFPALKDLLLQGNKLSTLPSSLFSLHNLEKLYLTDNRGITVIPSQISNLENLRALGLSGTNITSIPDEIGELENLHWIDLSYGKIRPPRREILQKWAKTMHPEVFMEIIESIPKEKSELRKF